MRGWTVCTSLAAFLWSLHSTQEDGSAAAASCCCRETMTFCSCSRPQLHNATFTLQPTTQPLPLSLHTQAARTPAAVSSTPAPPQPQPHSQPAQYILSPAKQQPHPPHPASPQQQLLGLQYWCVAEEGGPLPSNLSHDDMQLLAQAGAVVLMPTSVTQQAELTAGTAAVTEGGAGGSSSSCVVHNDIIPDPDLTYEEVRS